MVTYQDLLKVGENEKERIDFVRKAITDHMQSNLYRQAARAYKYYDGENETLMNYQKTLVKITGEVIPDIYAANHKAPSNFIELFVTQQNQYLLGNGISWNNGDETKKRLGEDFDSVVQDAGENALLGTVSFGFWNLDHVELFNVMEFAPLWDEENGSLRSGIRWWQIDSNKPLRATLYEEDGYTEYIWDRDKDGKENGAVLKEKRAYIINVRSSEIDGIEILDGENYPTFPIVPCWANKRHKNPLARYLAGVDAYDFIKNGYTNDFDEAQLYWIIKGAGGMDDPDLAQFLQRLKTVKAAAPMDGQEIEAVTVDIPYEAREKLLDRIAEDLYKDAMALDFTSVINGADTATQIKAAYDSLDKKCDKYEWCITKFVKAILALAKVDDDPTYTRSRVVNVQEEIQTILQAAPHLSQDYVTRKILTLLGDGDQADDIINQMAADELERGALLAENGEQTEVSSANNDEEVGE